MLLELKENENLIIKMYKSQIMKNLIICSFSLLLMFNISIESTFAQSDNQLFIIRSVKVDPPKIDAYEKSILALNEALNEANVSDVEYYMNSTLNYEYYAAVPIENMAALDKNYWAETVSKVGAENFEKLIATMQENVIETNLDIYQHQTDLKYKHSSLEDTEMGYREWLALEFRQGTHRQVKEIMKEWVALYKKYDIVRNINCYYAVIGPKEGNMIITFDSKDQVIAAQQDKDFRVKTGKEGYALWKRTEALLVSLETREGFFRPDLSRVPATQIESVSAK